MCLLVLKFAGTEFPTDHARTAGKHNADGFGAAWHDETRWHVHRTLVLDEHLELLPQLTKYNAVLHYRLATHGSETLDNVHPFLVGEPDDPEAFVVAHNGIFDIQSPYEKDDRSDTRLFVDHVFRYLRPGWIHDTILTEQLGEMIGGYNKVVALQGPQPKQFYRIWGAAAGHWDAAEKIWYSNNSYQRWVPAPSTATTSSVTTSSTVRRGYNSAVKAWQLKLGTNVRYFCDDCLDLTRQDFSEVSSCIGYVAAELGAGTIAGDQRCETCDERLGAIALGVPY